MSGVEPHSVLPEPDQPGRRGLAFAHRRVSGRTRSRGSPGAPAGGPGGGGRPGSRRCRRRSSGHRLTFIRPKASSHWTTGVAARLGGVHPLRAVIQAPLPARARRRGATCAVRSTGPTRTASVGLGARVVTLRRRFIATPGLLDKGQGLFEVGPGVQKTTSIPGSRAVARSISTMSWNDRGQDQVTGRTAPAPRPRPPTPAPTRVGVGLLDRRRQLLGRPTIVPRHVLSSRRPVTVCLGRPGPVARARSAAPGPGAGALTCRGPAPRVYMTRLVMYRGAPAPPGRAERTFP